MSPRARTVTPLEKDVQASVLALLQARGFHVFRRSVTLATAKLNPKQAALAAAGIEVKARRFMTAGVGQADLWGWHRETGRHLEVEVKRPGNTPTTDQSAWLEKALQGNCIAFWCDSVSSCDAFLKHFGV